MSDKTGIVEFVKECAEQGLEDPQEIAERFEVECPDLFAQVARVAVRWRVRSELRRFVRASEKKVFTPGASSGGTRVDDLRQLLAESFVIDDGTRVRWGEATVEHHQRRAAMMRNLADRNIADAARHERAIEMILQAGVTCLDEVASAPRQTRKTKAAA